jgi:hypothetical protein
MKTCVDICCKYLNKKIPHLSCDKIQITPWKGNMIRINALNRFKRELLCQREFNSFTRERRKTADKL